GIGFVLSKNDPFTGIDLDHVVTSEQEEMAISDETQAMVERFGSYTELTPSGSGLHIWIQAQVPGVHRRKGNVEIYDSARFLTMTGAQMEGCSDVIEERQDELDRLCAELWPSKPDGNDKQLVASTPGLTAYEILELARRHKNADKWDRLMRGETGGYSSAS